MNLLKSVLFSKEEVDGGILTAEETTKDKELEETKKKMLRNKKKFQKNNQNRKLKKMKKQLL